jgi:uncharacterized protein YndB with AHSA1/START domain
MSAEATTKDFVIARSFAAPRDLIWKCFTDPERMKEWWGPKGSTIVASKMDFRVGGTYHGAMGSPGGPVMWAKFVYREIVPPQRLVWVHSFSDEAMGLTRHPMSPTWPLEILTTVMFEEEPGNTTKVTLRWSPMNATAEEQATFDAAHGGMQGGWTGTFERLDAYLAATQPKS